MRRRSAAGSAFPDSSGVSSSRASISTDQQVTKSSSSSGIDINQACSSATTARHQASVTARGGVVPAEHEVAWRRGSTQRSCPRARLIGVPPIPGRRGANQHALRVGEEPPALDAERASGSEAAVVAQFLAQNGESIPVRCETSLANSSRKSGWARAECAAAEVHAFTLACRIARELFTGPLNQVIEIFCECARASVKSPRPAADIQVGDRIGFEREHLDLEVFGDEQCQRSLRCRRARPCRDRNSPRCFR